MIKMPYTLALIAGLCFVSGLYLISSEGDYINGTTRNTAGLS